jgi:hypothetical protein
MNLSLRSLFLGIAAIGLAASVQAEDLKTADEVIAKNIEARGGMEAIKAIQTTRAEGTMTMGPMQMPFTVEMKRPNQMRLDFSLQGMQASQAYDGTAGWQIMPMMGKLDAEPMSGDELKQFKNQADMDGALVDYKSKGSKVELLGVVDVDGTQAYKLKLTRDDGSEEINYIDTEYFLAIKTESSTKIQGQDMQGSAILGDYKEVAGTMIPHSITNVITGPMGEIKQEMLITKIETNIDVGADRFAQPAPKAAKEVAK